MKKILVCMNDVEVGGVTAVVQNIYRKLDREKFCMDFIAKQECENEFIKEIIANGDKIYYINNCNMNTIPVLNYHFYKKNMVKQICTKIQRGYYDIAYIHANAYFYLPAVNKLKIPVRIVHIHEAVSDFCGNENKSKLTHVMWESRKKMYNRLATVKAGDSLRACRAKFGDNVVNDPKLAIIHPLVDMEKFNPHIYSVEQAVSDFKIDTSCFNMIHVGRLNPVKNQKFMIDVMREINKTKPAHLYIVGDGELRGELIKYAESMKVSDKLTILPADTSPEIYTAMDCSLLPSFSEAFGMVAVESQLMGVPCFASTNVPEDVDIGMCSFLPLESGPQHWAKTINDYNYKDAAINNSVECFTIKKIMSQLYDIFDGSI